MDANIEIDSPETLSKLKEINKKKLKFLRPPINSTEAVKVL